MKGEGRGFKIWRILECKIHSEIIVEISKEDLGGNTRLTG